MRMKVDPKSALMRASQMKANIQFLAILEADQESQILAKVLPETLSRIKNASRIEWLPLELDIEVTEAVQAVVGEVGLYAWSRDSLLESLKGGMLGPLTKGSLRVFGVNPRSLYKVAPFAWDTTYRNCGDLRVDYKGSNQIHIVAYDLPRLMLDSSVYLRGIAGAFDAVMKLTEAYGRVLVRPNPKDDRSVVFIASWR